MSCCERASQRSLKPNPHFFKKLPHADPDPNDARFQGNNAAPALNHRVAVMNEKENRRLLEAAAASGDAVAIENAVRCACSDGLKTAYVLALIEILTQANHQRHEDVVTALQILKDPRAADALFHAALIQHDYLNYDDNFGLARKCTWALADIGSPTAFEYLRRLAAGSNEVIAGYAQKRLELWEDECGRKAWPHQHER